MSFRHVISRLAPWSWIAAFAFWGWAAWIWVDRYVRMPSDPVSNWLNDWHVYAAAARDFVRGDLYHVPLVSEFTIPVGAFNYPPGSAAIVVPFLALPDSVGGLLFVILNVVSIAAAAVLTMVIVDARPVWLWSGIVFFCYSFSGWSAAANHGNNTPLVLLFVAGAVASHVSNRAVLAGVLLGIAIALKLWPAALAVPLARERSWLTLGWAGGIAAGITGGGLIWLGGPAAVGPMISAFLIDIEPRQSHPLFLLTWLRVQTDWWPEWGGYAVAALLLLIPATGRLGYGVATFAGLAAIPNVWRHYLSTMVFAALLVISGLARRRRERDAVAHEGAAPHSRAEPLA